MGIGQRVARVSSWAGGISMLGYLANVSAHDGLAGALRRSVIDWRVPSCNDPRGTGVLDGVLGLAQKVEMEQRAEAALFLSAQRS